MSDQQVNTETNGSQAKPCKNTDKSARVKALYPYTEFDLYKVRKRVFDQFDVPKTGFFRSIIELLMERVNGQYIKYTNMRPQIGYGETVPISDECIAEQVGCKVSTVASCRRFCRKAGLLGVTRAKGKYGNSRCGIWVYVFIGYLTLEPQQQAVMFKETEADILVVDFEGYGTNPTEGNVQLKPIKKLVRTNISESPEQPSNPDYDRVSEGSEISANKIALKKQYTSSSIEEEDGKIYKAKQTNYSQRNEPVEQVDSALEKALVKVSQIRMDSEGNSNPIDEATKPQFRIWLDKYATVRSKDLDISYEEALELLPVAWGLANRYSLHYRPENPLYFCHGKTNTYAKPLLYDALKAMQSGGESEQQEQETEMDIDTILGQDYDEKPSNSEEEEVQMYIRKYRQLLIRRQANDGSALKRVMHNTTAQRLGDETVMRLLKVEGVVG